MSDERRSTSLANRSYHLPGEPRKQRWHRYPLFNAILVFILVCVLVTAGFATHLYFRHQESLAATENILSIFTARLEERMASYIRSVSLLRIDWQHRDQVNQEEFERIASKVVEAFPSLQAVNWMDDDGIIRWVYPLEPNRAALGLDVKKNPGARETYESVRDEADFAVSYPLDLAQGGRGIVVYYRVIRDGVQNGFLQAVICIEDFIGPLYTDGLSNSYRLRILDGDAMVFQTEPFQAGPQIAYRSFDVGKHRWRVEIQPFADFSSGGFPLAATALLGLLGAFAFAYLVYRLQSSSMAREYAEHDIWYSAHFDPVTALPNRRSLQLVMDDIRDDNWSYVLMVVNLKRLRLINAVHGSRLGDKVLDIVARRLERLIGFGSVFHLGSDEFATIVRTDSLDEADHWANSIIEVVQSRIDVDGIELIVDCKLGYVLVTDTSESSEQVITEAGAALMQARKDQRHRVYDDTIRDASKERLTLERDLRHALENSELSVNFQPIIKVSDVDFRHSKLIGFEALMRWHHPKRGMIPPDLFIPIAEDTGLIDKIGMWILDASCRQLAFWRKTKGRNVYVGVNVSARQMLDLGFADQIRAVLKKYELEADALTLEITESLAITNIESAIDTLNSLREVGVRIAMDDFGTGYSSLSYLNLLPIDIVKLDRSFIRKMHEDARNLHVVQSVIHLAKGLGIEVVAEGVETEAHLMLLRDAQCDYAQGYLISKPVPAELIENLYAA